MYKYIYKYIYKYKYIYRYVTKIYTDNQQVKPLLWFKSVSFLFNFI